MGYPENFGLLEERTVNPKDWRVGGITGADREVLREDGDYRDYLPEKEVQIGLYFDTMGCVSFSALNVLEIIAKVKGWDINRSDRFTAKKSGTTRRGNYLSKVADSIAKDHGTVDEESWPYPRRQRTPVFDWEDFYAPVPDEVTMEGRRWLQDFEVQHEWLSTASLGEWLKYGPIQVTVQAWPFPNSDGLYENKAGDISYNHAVTLVYAGDDYYEIWDSYDNDHKRLVPDYTFGHAKRFTLKRKTDEPMPIIDLRNDILVQEVEQSGTFGLHLNGKILLGDTESLLATWLMRNSGNVDGKVHALTKEQWDSFSKQDLKGNPL